MLSLLCDPGVRPELRPSDRAELRRRLRRMLRAVALTEGSEAELELSVRLTDDETIRELNRDFRGKDRSTDVLAFAQREGEGGGLHPELLGDVVVSVETAERQRRDRGLDEEMLFLCTHGLCHLLGYDHQTDEEEAVMNARMEALLAESARKGRVRAA